LGGFSLKARYSTFAYLYFIFTATTSPFFRLIYFF
jgi:hypothetical protein